MKILLHNIDQIAKHCRNVTVLFSTGRDSTVMLDLFMQRARESVGLVVFMHMAPGLFIHERILQYYEKRYKIEITRLPHPDSAMTINTREKKHKITNADFEKYLRISHGAEWIAYGYRKDESLQRRGQLTLAKEGIDWKYRKVFPIAEWAAKHCAGWVKRSRLILPPEYAMGIRDITSFKGPALLYLVKNYPEDYERIAAVYPDVKAELMRAIDKERENGE